MPNNFKENEQKSLYNGLYLTTFSWNYMQNKSRTMELQCLKSGGNVFVLYGISWGKWNEWMEYFKYVANKSEYLVWKLCPKLVHTK